MARTAALAAACALLLGACGGSADDAEPRGEPSQRTLLPAPSPTRRATVTSPTPSPPPSVPEDLRLALVPAVEGLDNPTWVTSPPDDPRLFVLEQGGRVRVVRDGRLLPEPFIDLSPRVLAGGERGLLGLAFHPRYAATGRFYVHYTADPDGDTEVVEYTVTSRDPDRADPASRRVVLTLEQPASQHNGGMIRFGPDGMFYVGLGDGGGEPRGQDPSTLYGTILRIDVDRRDGGRPYGIPPDNPFADGREGHPAVWHHGLRNPWRFAFDDGLLYIGDVGEFRFEEIDVVPADVGGSNFGWPIREGRHCFPARECRAEGLVDPVFEYDHDDGRCAVVAGPVYRGRSIPGIVGRFFYTDFCDGRLRSLRVVDGEVTEHRDWTPEVGTVPAPLSFGTDADDELYLTASDGVVYRIVADR